MRSKSKKALSIILTLVMVFSIFAATAITAGAEDALELAQYINSFSHGGQGKLEARIEGVGARVDTVVVTGSVTGATNKLTLNIGDNSIGKTVTVDWRAVYEGNIPGIDVALITLTGPGIFEIAEGGLIKNNGGDAINAAGVGSTIFINGGTVSTTGDYCRTILLTGTDSKVTVDSGMVSATDGFGGGAIVGPDRSRITVNGGTVSSTGNKTAITGSSISITGGTVSAIDAYAITTRYTPDGARANLMISGGTVTSFAADTIHASVSNITISGGTVSNLSGGTSVGGYSAISIHDRLNATINGSAFVMTGGTLNAASGCAIRLVGTDSTIAVTGGFMFAPQANITGTARDAVIWNEYADWNDHGAPAPIISSPAVVCGWNKAGGTSVYDTGMSTDLVVAPDGASVKWAKTGAQSGVSYKNAANEGFFPIEGIMVVEPPISPPALTPGMFNFTKSRSYAPGQFPDVDENEWYGYNELGFIATAFEYALVNGYEDGNFGPTDAFTVAQAIALAARINSIYYTGYDLEQGEPWYQVFLDYALAYDIILSNDFPDIHRPATRAEMAYIFSRCLPDNEFESKNTVNSLPDVPAGTPYRESIFLLYEAGVISGNDDIGTFTPNSNMDRAMAAGIITKIIVPSNRTINATYG